jgi:hypothetical protein
MLMLLLQEKLDAYWKEITRYVLDENKQNWQGCFVSLWGIDAGVNKLNYSLWVTARGTTFREVRSAVVMAIEYNMQQSVLTRCISRSQFLKLYTARRALIEHMRNVQLDMSIEFMNITQPVAMDASSCPVFGQQFPPLLKKQHEAIYSESK